MNILITVTNLGERNGGVSSHVVDLCKGLKDLGNNVFVASNGGLYSKKLDEIGVTHFLIDFQDIQKHPILLLRVFSRLKSIVKENEIDIIHTHGQSQILFCQLIRRKYNVPFVWTNHIDAIPQKKLFKTLYRLSRFDIISVSMDLQEYISKILNIDPIKIHVINNGVNMDRYYKLSNEEFLSLNNEFGVKENQIVLSLIGRINWVKGHMLLLEAITELKGSSDFKNFHVLVAGKIDDSSTQKEYIKSLEEFAKVNEIDLTFTGFRDVREVIGISNALILPSFHEGFPIVCIEGFAMKCPVIRSDASGSTDMKNLCYIFPKGNVTELAKGIQHMLDPNTKIDEQIKYSYNYTVNNLTKEKMVIKTLKVYEEILAKEK